MISTTKKLAVFGHGGHAKEVQAQIGEFINFFVDEDYLTIGSRSISEFDPDEYAIMIAVGDPTLRALIVERLPKNTEYFTFIHPTALLMDPFNITIGQGSFIGAHSIITTNVEIGEHAILNRGVQIGHDCRIGNFFSAMPGAVVSGSCSIGNRVYLGTNSSIIENTKVVNRVTLGMGGVLVRDADVPGIYIGVPAEIHL